MINTYHLIFEMKQRVSVNNHTLTIHCDKKDVVIEKYLYDNKIGISRDDGDYLFCYTWNGISGDCARNILIFVNLITGEQYSVVSPYLHRGIFKFSPNNKFLLIETYKSTSGENRIFLLDLTNLSSINLILSEEVSYGYNYYFDEGSNFVSKFDYEFFEYKGTAVSEENLDDIKEIFNKERPHLVDDRDLWRAGVTINPVSVTIIRKYNSNKVTPLKFDKWNDSSYPLEEFTKIVEQYKSEGLDPISANNKANSKLSQAQIDHLEKYRTYYGTFCTVNEMDEINVIKSDNFDHFIGNVFDPFNLYYLEGKEKE